MYYYENHFYLTSCWLSQDSLLLESKRIIWSNWNVLFGWIEMHYWSSRDLLYGRVVIYCLVKLRCIVGRVEIYCLIESMITFWSSWDPLLVKSRFTIGQVDIYSVIESRFTVWSSQNALYGWAQKLCFG